MPANCHQQILIGLYCGRMLHHGHLQLVEKPNHSEVIITKKWILLILGMQYLQILNILCLLLVQRGV